jgi:hypothetical protein
MGKNEGAAKGKSKEKNNPNINFLLTPFCLTH